MIIPEIITMDGEHVPEWEHAYKVGAGCSGFAHIQYAKTKVENKQSGCAARTEEGGGISHAAGGWIYNQTGNINSP